MSAQASSSRGADSSSAPLTTIKAVIEAAIAAHDATTAGAGEASGTSSAASSKVQAHLYSQLSSQWRFKPNGQRVFAVQSVQGTDPLDLLDPADHSLAYLFILSARLDSIGRVAQGASAAAATQETAAVIDAIEPRLQAFVTEFTASHVRLASERAHAFNKDLSRIATLVRDDRWGLQYMQSFLIRYLDLASDPPSPNTNILSSLHPPFLFQCLKAREYNVAMTVLRHEIAYAPKKAMYLTYTDALEYFYYGSLIFGKLGYFTQAINFLDQCISVPTQTVSAIQTDALKKRILLQLLRDGKTSDYPSFVSDRVKSTVRSLPEAYGQFAGYYANKSRSMSAKVYAHAQKNASEFQKDANLGLVQQCLCVYRLRRIQRFGQMFTSISAADLSALLGDKDMQEGVTLQQEIAEATARGWVNASFSPSPDGTPFVYFHPVPPAVSLADDAAVTERLVHAMQEATYWSTLIAQEERRLSRDERFLTKLAKQARLDSTGRMAGTLGDDMDDEIVF